MPDPFDLGAIDRAHVWHPYTQHATSPAPIAIARAEGAYLYDTSGRPIFDAISSWWVTLHGHAHPVIAAAIAEQARTLEQVMFAGFTHEPAVRLAAALVDRAPVGLSRVFYSDNGSTAVEVGVKMALQYWRNAGEPRPLIVALEHAYHGDTFGAMSISASGLFTAPFADHLFEVIRLPDPATSDMSDAFERVLEERGREIAAVIVEPMLLGAGGMRMWSAESLGKLRARTAREGILLIADEVLTGFGRTGPLFACEHAGVAPDILCLSKGLTGGFLPMGVTMATERVFERFLSDDRRRTLFHGHSYTANPLACAAAIASWSLLDDACASRRQAIERRHRSAAAEFAAHRAVRGARVLGTVFACEIASENGYLNPLGAELHVFALEHGVLLRPLGNTVYVLPPYCSTDADLDRVYAVLRSFLEGR
jgi:adenosylmethionine---8-amino-7-oxononanoate aminotransferase